MVVATLLTMHPGARQPLVAEALNDGGSPPFDGIGRLGSGAAQRVG
jgi:hypothetical protein